METTTATVSFLYDILLPRVEKLGLLVTVLGVLAALTLVGRYETLLIVGLGTLGLTSFLNTYKPRVLATTDGPYFEPITGQNQFSNSSNPPSFLLDSLCPKLIGISGAFILVGTLFKLMLWSGGANMLLVGTGIMLIFVLLMALNQRINMRSVVLAAIGIVMFTVSEETLMRQLHRDDPQLVELIVYQLHYPHDRAAAQAVRMRMNQMRHRR